MPKFKFSNKSDAGGEGVVVLPCNHMKEHTYQFTEAGGEITTQFDKTDNWAVRLTISGSWFTVNDLDDLIELLKSAKKRVEKNEAKRLDSDS